MTSKKFLIYYRLDKSYLKRYKTFLLALAFDLIFLKLSKKVFSLQKDRKNILKIIVLLLIITHCRC